MPSVYSFEDYSPSWPGAFREEAERLQALLGDELVTVHHIGSTSVPGLASKPIIDMIPLVRVIERLDARTELFENAGYKAWGEYGLPGRRYFTKDLHGVRTHNAHFYQHDSPDVDRHLAFAAFLRGHDEMRNEYEALKRAVYALHPADVLAYNAGKDAWIKKIETIALAWYRRSRPEANK